jgi:excisionase family DNA binding protein
MSGSLSVTRRRSDDPARVVTSSLRPSSPGVWYLRIDRSARVPMIPDPRSRPVMTAEEVFAELGIDRSTGYKAIRDGTFPIAIVRVGRLIRIPTVAVRRLLEMETFEADEQPPQGGGN